MANFGIDGLASGLNTTDIINSLMRLEAAPQTLLKSKQSNLQSVVSALQGVNVRIQSVQSAAAKAADPANWNAFTASSSSQHVAATATSDAQAGSLSFTVGAIATRQVSLSNAVTDGAQLTADDPPTLTLKKSDGTFVSVTAASNSLADIASAINDSDMGVKATTVRVAGGEPPTYRLQFTADATGVDGAFELYIGDEAAVVAETATRLDGNLATAAADASITLWEGTPYAQTVTQSSNTFEDVLNGVSITVSAAAEIGEEVTINVAADGGKVKALASDLVNTLSVVLSEIGSRTAASTSTGADGRLVVSGGLLSGDSTVRSALDQLTQAAIYPVNGASPSSIGINIDRYGAITFDEDVFASAVASDPDGVAEMVQALAGRVETVATNLSDPYEGVLTGKIKANESLVTDYGRQIESWDTRLESRRATLQATYSALEVTLSNLQSQSSWLAGQLASLPSMNTGRA
jgi:flagellar hook-associated protein 2